MNLLFCSRNFKEIRYGEKFVVGERTVSKWIAQKDSEGVDWTGSA
jgi:hypothetical protein